jgi:hypothetical protein
MLPRSYQQPDVPLSSKVTAGYRVNVFRSLPLSFHLPLLSLFYVGKGILAVLTCFISGLSSFEENSFT